MRRVEWVANPFGAVSAWPGLLRVRGWGYRSRVAAGVNRSRSHLLLSREEILNETAGAAGRLMLSSSHSGSDHLLANLPGSRFHH